MPLSGDADNANEMSRCRITVEPENRSRLQPTLLRIVACAIVFVTSVPHAVQAQEAPVDLTTLRLEDLMNLDVTSAAKKPQKLSRAPAAIFIISREDIRRSGASNLPDLLRMVPGLEVAQINPSSWAISARGFNGQYSNKLLVLVDGRSVYNPVFSGVFWDEQDVAPDLIERIEVIRGPGAAVWGLNAVNGVVNIILRTAAETRGGLLTLSAGSEEHISGVFRYGGKLGNTGTYRVHANGFENGSLPTLNHQNGDDDWHRASAGFRVDEDYSLKNSMTIEGQATRGREGEIATAIVSLDPPITGSLAAHGHFSEWNTVARWKHTASAGSQTSLQTYFDHASRDNSTYGGSLNTLDLDFQQQARMLPHQDFVWGLGYRLNADKLDDSFRISFQPASLNSQIFSAFLQDEIALLPNRLFLSLGGRLQHDYYNGFNFQPTTQLSWSAGERAMLWAQFSRAQRMPSRAETAMRWNLAAFPGPGNLPTLVSLFGNPQQKNEQLNASEAGLRKEFSSFVSIDVAAYSNRYRDLASIEPETPRLESTPQPVHLLDPYTFANGLHGTTRGLELFGHVKLANRWTLSPGYTFFSMHVPADSGSVSLPAGLSEEGQNPRQQAQLRSYINLSTHWQWSNSAYFVGRLDSPAVPSYTRFDSVLFYRASDQISFMLAGQNLLKDLHQEYGDSDVIVSPNLIRRSAYFKLVWHLK